MNRRKLIKILSITLCVLVVFATGLGIYTYNRVKSIAGDPMQVLKNLTGGLGQEEQPKQYITYNGESYYYNNDIVTLMLIGIDERANNPGLGARADVMVVAALDTKQNTVKLIKLPRDTRTQVRHTDSDGNFKKEAMDKLNASYPYGGGRKGKGAENTMFCVQRVLNCNGKFNIPLSKYGGINMDGISPLADAVGGVTITLDAYFPGLGNKGDVITLDADKAFTYCVQRKGKGLDGSDIGRGNRQMNFLKGLAAKIKTLDVTSMPSLYSKLSKYAFTNLTTDEMIAYASLLSKVDMSNLETIQADGTAKTINKISYWIIDQSSLEEIVLDTFYIKDPTHTPETDE